MDTNEHEGEDHGLHGRHGWGCSHGAVRRPRRVAPKQVNAPQGRGYRYCFHASVHYSLRNLPDQVLKNLSRSRKNLTTNGHKYALIGYGAKATADLKLARIPPRSPLPFAALPSVSLLPA